MEEVNPRHKKQSTNQDLTVLSLMTGNFYQLETRHCLYYTHINTPIILNTRTLKPLQIIYTNILGDINS